MKNSLSSGKAKKGNLSSSNLNGKYDLARTINKMETFSRVNYMCASNDSEEYVAGIVSKQRYWIVILTRVILLLNSIRCLVLTLARKECVDRALLNFTHILGNSFVIITTISALSLAISAIGLTTIYQEFSKTLYMAEICYLISHNIILYPAKELQFRSMLIKANLVIDYIMKPSFYTLVVFVSLIHLISSGIYLLSFEWEYMQVILWLLYNFIWLVFAHQCFGYVWFGFVLWFLSTLYLKTKFQEVNEKIELSLKHSNVNLLMYAINEHNYVETLTKQFNHFFRVITFIIYYIATIGFQIMLYLTHRSDIKIVGRVSAGFIFTTCFWAVVFMNVMSTWVSTAAHKPYLRLYSIICRRTRMRFRQHWKLLSFIEKLSGRPIGYYCYDLFPMTNYEFYQYLLIAGSNYFLIMNLLS